MAKNRASSKSEMARLISVISKGSFVLFAWNSDATLQMLRAMPMLQIIRLATESAKDMFLELSGFSSYGVSRSCCRSKTTSTVRRL